MTDDERLLRDLAYPLIEPPYDRQRWYSFLNEYGIARIFRHDWSRFDEHGLCAGAARAFRCARKRHAMRDSMTTSATIAPASRRSSRWRPAFSTWTANARRVGLGAILRCSEWEQRNALARNAENSLVVSWVQWSLAARAVSYRFALERLVIMAPMPVASEVERSLIALQDISEYRLLPDPDVAPGRCRPLPPFEGPLLPARG